MKRVLVMISVLAAVVVAAVFVSRALSEGRHADACAERLLTAVQGKDASFVTRAVANPAARDRLLSGAPVELVFVRPVDPGFSRVGLVVSSTVPDGRPGLLLLMLDHADPECSFLRDHDDL